MRTFKRSSGKRTKADHSGTLSVPLLGTTCCIPMGHDSGLCQAFIVAHYSLLWHVLDRIGKPPTMASFQLVRHEYDSL